LINPWFYKQNQKLGDAFKFLDLDLGFLNQLKKHAYCLINCAISDADPVPNGYDLYVFSWFFEPFVDVWFLDIYQKNPQAEFVIITDLEPNALAHLPRVQVFNSNTHTTWINAIRSQNSAPITGKLIDRKYKISSLSSRLSEYKFFITAKLLESQSTEAFYSWNRGFAIHDKDSWVFEQSGYQQTDSLLKHSDYLKNNTINLEKFKNNPLSNCQFQHPAFNNSIVNAVNESQNISETPEFGTLPLALITEKTWKPLFAGNALLFTCQALTKKKLENWGFKFDYPWAQGYDDNLRDSQRLEVILSHITWILSLPNSTLIALCEESVQHNVELAWSGKLESQFRAVNERCVAELQRHFQ